MHSQRPSKPDITPPAAPRPEAVKLRARRSPKLIAVGVLLVVLGGLGAAALYLSNVDMRSVVVMSQTVQRGDVVERGSLGIVDVPGNFDVPTIDESQLGSLVGQRALTDLPHGAFPQLSSVGEDPLPAGQSLVGLRLPLGRVPASHLPPGTAVRVVGLIEGVETSTPAVVATAPTLLDDGLTYSVDVSVADADADAVARLAATDQAAIVVVGGS